MDNTHKITKLTIVKNNEALNQKWSLNVIDTRDTDIPKISAGEMQNLPNVSSKSDKKLEKKTTKIQLRNALTVLKSWSYLPKL